MKAIVMRSFGSPEVLRLEDFPTPQAGSGELVFQVHAVSVNRTLDLVAEAHRLVAAREGLGKVILRPTAS